MKGHERSIPPNKWSPLSPPSPRAFKISFTCAWVHLPLYLYPFLDSFSFTFTIMESMYPFVTGAGPSKVFMNTLPFIGPGGGRSG